MPLGLCFEHFPPRAPVADANSEGRGWAIKFASGVCWEFQLFVNLWERDGFLRGWVIEAIWVSNLLHPHLSLSSPSPAPLPPFTALCPSYQLGSLSEKQTRFVLLVCINSRSDLSSSVDPTQADTKLNDLNIKPAHGGQIPSVCFSFSTLSLLINLVPSKQCFFFPKNFHLRDLIWIFWVYLSDVQSNHIFFIFHLNFSYKYKTIQNQKWVYPCSLPSSHMPSSIEQN